MAHFNALPPPNFRWIDDQGRPTSPFAAFMADVGNNVLGPLRVVAVPNNANALAAGVALGELYTSTADPAIVYVRTV